MAATVSLPRVFRSLSVAPLPLIEPLRSTRAPLRTSMPLLSLYLEATRTRLCLSQTIVNLSLRVRSRRIADLTLRATFGEYVLTSGPSSLSAAE